MELLAPPPAAKVRTVMVSPGSGNLLASTDCRKENTAVGLGLVDAFRRSSTMSNMRRKSVNEVLARIPNRHQISQLRARARVLCVCVLCVCLCVATRDLACNGTR